MKNVLVHVRDDDGMEARLQAALDLVRAGGGHLTCLQATPFDSYIVGDPFGGVYAFPEILARVREGEEATRTRIEGHLGKEGVSWDWLHFDGAAAQMLVDRARLADAVVVSQPVRERGGSAPLPIAADIALHARAPVLAVPGDARGIDCAGAALVAWNGSAEAAHALRLAVPLLQRASTVHIVTVGGDGGDLPSTEACRYLSRHSIGSELHAVGDAGEGVEAAILSVARETNAAYIVMGAYGRSRLRELVLGGVTDGLLHSSPLPLLLSH